VANGLERLLIYLAEHEIIGQEQKDVQLTASSREPGEAIAADVELARQRERQRASTLAPAFAEGLRRAYHAHRDGQHGLTLDDRRADENAMADALIQFLVRPHLAASHTEPTEPSHYAYTITVDWPRLAQIAAEGGIDLDAELTQS
jgi:hypothetical protein